MLDDRTATAPPASPYVGEFVWTRPNNVFAWRALLGGEPGGEDVSPYAAPARAKDLSGLPPTYLACGALDLFLEENLEYARRLMTVGVPTEMHVYPGAPHAFMVAADAYVSQAFARDSFAALKRALAG
jgi:triacylglycerol lipase